MTREHFWQGIGIGLVAGVAAGMAMQPRKRAIKDKANKAMRAVGGAVGNITESMGM